MALQKLLFIGPPGAGKGTQAKFLSEYGFKHVSTGDVIRQAWKDEDSLLMPYKKSIEEGCFLPDELIFELIKKNTSSHPKYILDGAVRTIAQAKFAVENNLIDAVLFFSLSKEEAVKRLTKRREIENRVDDSPEAIKERFNQYTEKTQPVLDYLKSHVENYFEIDASPKREEIRMEIERILKIN